MPCYCVTGELNATPCLDCQAAEAQIEMNAEIRQREMYKGVCSVCQQSGLPIYLDPSVDTDPEEDGLDPFSWIIHTHEFAGKVCVGTGTSPQAVYRS